MGSGVSLALEPPNRRNAWGRRMPRGRSSGQALGLAGFPDAGLWPDGGSVSHGARRGRAVRFALSEPFHEMSFQVRLYLVLGPRLPSVRGVPLGGTRLLPDRNQAYRAISTGQLNASPRLHLQPIDVVVFHGPQGRPGFEGGFPLRCLQRLSCPIIATLHCRWHDNRSTSGSFTPVLSY